jgi:uncharacterized protein (DUF58 family)
MLAMSVDDKHRSRGPRGRFRGLARRLFGALWPTQRRTPTREGYVYFAVGILLLAAGVYHQVNLILLVFALSAGPIVASLLSGRTLLHRLSVQRRVPAYVFSGEGLTIDYTLENARRWQAALAIYLEESLVPIDRLVSGSAGETPRVFFSRVAAGERARLRWQCKSPRRGKYEFRELFLGTRAPFGLVEHRAFIALDDQIIVYPEIGHLTRRWYQMQRQATENSRGLRHDQSAQQLEYHGLRGYRPGDSPRWIHWRTSARRGELMVKEFEQQNEQDLAILVDPWLPRTKALPEQRAALEEAISFAATLCVETCRHQGQRVVLGWTGAAPGVRHGPASVKLLHELLEPLAMLRPDSEGGLAALFDAIPPAVLREALLVIVSTRPLNLIEEAERSSRFTGTSARGLLGRVLSFNATAGELSSLLQFEPDSAQDLLDQRPTGAILDRRASQEERRRQLSADNSGAGLPRAPREIGDAGP